MNYTILAIIVAIVIITVFCRAMITLERIKGVSQNAGQPEKYSTDVHVYNPPTTISDGMSQP